jgi:hypothetical protein
VAASGTRNTWVNQQPIGGMQAGRSLKDLKMAQDALDLRLTFNLFYIETISSN